MNTLRRPRRRPRVDSLSFRTLAWLLVREAYVLAVNGRPVDARLDWRFRTTLLSYPTSYIMRRYAQYVRHHPERGIR